MLWFVRLSIVVDVPLTLRPYVRDPVRGPPLEGWDDRGSLPISHLMVAGQRYDWVEDKMKANLRSPPANQLSG